MLRGGRDADDASPGSSEGSSEAWADVAVPASAWTGYFLEAAAAAIGVMSAPLIVPIAMLLMIACDTRRG